jgi:predicted ATPase
MDELPRGTVTLLFTDTSGSTRMLQRLGEGHAGLLDECRRLLRTVFHTSGGHEVATQGDAFFVAFAHATDAVLASVTAQRALFVKVWPDDVTVRVRMGLHTGEPHIASESYVGLDVQHTARIMSAGHAGQVLLSQTTRDLVEQALPDGVFFVSLIPVIDPLLVLPTIAQTLGIGKVVEKPLREHMREELQQKKVLVVLDNFEHVISAAPHMKDLLVACPELKLLVTSREVLRVRAEHEFVVPPLAVPDRAFLIEHTEFLHYGAFNLFNQRARAVKFDFLMTPTNARTIAEICMQLDGLPLAIELAAARMKLLSPQALLARLSHRLQILTSGVRDSPTRHQSLRNTIAWSYNLLNAEEQQLFRRLSVFTGGCTLEAIEAMHVTLESEPGMAQVVDTVASLIDKSLVQRAEQEENESRLLMLETIRE